MRRLVQKRKIFNTCYGNIWCAILKNSRQMAGKNIQMIEEMISRVYVTVKC